MDAFLTDETSCAMLRISRYSLEPRVGTSGLRTVSIDEGSRVQWWRSAVREVRRYIDVDADHPLCVSVPDEQSRVRSHLVRSSIHSVPLPAGSYLTAELDLSGIFVALESPAHSFASLAAVLDRALHKGRLDQVQARAILLAYGYELCGTYALDAAEPLTADAHYRLEPAATGEDLMAWCQAQAIRGARGIALARTCAPEVQCGSASPAETIHAIMLTSSPELGGLGMSREDVLLNQSLHLGLAEQALVHRLPLTPDITFAQLGGRVLEHQGGQHDRTLQYREDASRIQDYAALGRPVITTSATDLASPTAYDAFLRRFLAWVRHDLGPRTANPYQEILDDPACTDARHHLLATLTDRIHDQWAW